MICPNIKLGKMNANKVLKINDSPHEGHPDSPIVEGNQTITKEIASGDIEFHNVWFRYPYSDLKWILKGINLTIPAGKSIGISGPSG